MNTRARRPGDLWGVDSKGNLLIVENKLQGSGDPFQEFIEFVEDSGEPGGTACELEERWKELLDKEKKPARLWRNDPRGTYPGVLPYSRHRAELRRRPDVTEKVERLAHGTSYKQGVDPPLFLRCIF